PEGPDDLYYKYSTAWCTYACWPFRFVALNFSAIFIPSETDFIKRLLLKITSRSKSNRNLK
ncbi:MAG: hypothetical protein ABL927_08545, partial [Bdellovibrionales bacterium]